MRDLTGLLHDNASDQYNPMQQPSTPAEVIPKAHKSGYLFERKNGRVYQSWLRKYFSIYDDELISTTRGSKISTKEEDGTHVYNLRVCSVKLTDGYDRRFCFEVISPNRVLVLQAENEQDMNEWIASIRTASQTALNSEDAPRYVQGSPNVRKSLFESQHKETNNDQDQEKQRESLRKIRMIPGNNQCADCKEKDPEWSCTNLGIIVMLRLGNSVGNGIYEAFVPKHMEPFRIDPSSNRNDRDLWIIEKYAKRSFVKQSNLDQSSLDKAFWEAIVKQDLPQALKRLAQGAHVDYGNPEEELRTALHKAVDGSDEVSVEFLLQRLSDIDQQDERGWTALHYAAANNNVRLVLALLKRHAKADIKDNADMVSKH
ncbi:hypothetical protein EDC96DRAFT_446306 [Choanephora cucurbitarum]|nr:hypothetical protein EDC96DRAFT_446306 [Choanephora cucurbitarum]